MVKLNWQIWAGRSRREPRTRLERGARMTRQCESRLSKWSESNWRPKKRRIDLLVKRQLMLDHLVLTNLSS